MRWREDTNLITGLLCGNCSTRGAKSAQTAYRIGFLFELSVVLAIVFAISVGVGVRFTLTTGAARPSGKVFEQLSGLWTLAVYLGLGLVPYFSLYVFGASGN